MRILHVVPTYLPATRYGGPIYSVHGLCKALASLDVETHVYTTNVDGAANSDVPLGEPVDLEGVKVTYFDSRIGRRIYYSSQMDKTLKNTVSSFDLVHVHSVYLWPTLAACRAAIAADVPYVLAPRGMLVSELIRAKSRWIKSLWIRLFDAKNVRRAAALHLTSRLEQDELNRVVVHATPVWIVPNGVDIPADNSWRGSIDGDQVLFIGRINWKKGLETLIRAVKMGAPGRYTIAGNDEDNYLPKLQKLVDEYGLQNRFSFPGPVFGAEKEALFQSADLFVMPSVNENFGNITLEAMAQGCPVAVSESSGIAGEVPAGAVCLMQRTEQSVAEAITSCLGSKEKRRKLSENGFAAAQSFSWTSVAHKMIAQYETLVNG